MANLAADKRWQHCNRWPGQCLSNDQTFFLSKMKDSKSNAASLVVMDSDFNAICFVIIPNSMGLYVSRRHFKSESW